MKKETTIAQKIMAFGCLLTLTVMVVPLVLLLFAMIAAWV